MRGVSVLVGTMVVTAVVASACGSATDSGSGGSGGGGGSAASGNGGSGAISLDGAAASGGSGGLTGCDKETYTGELVPLDMFVMFDRSGSMNESGKWGSVTTALNNFVKLPNLTKLGMGIAFFPTKPAVPPPGPCTSDPECGFYGPCIPGFNTCSGSFSPNDSCVSTDYQTPVVGIEDLPGVGSKITAAIGATSPAGDSTPMAPALEGAIDYATVWAAGHADRITVVVLATDGEPTNCTPNTVSDAAKWAAEGLAQTPSVRTFVVGVGDLSALDAIAAAGGTDKAILVSAGNATTEFMAALDKIRGAVGCNYIVPTPTNGSADPNKVNVAFTPDGQPEEILPFKTSAAECKGGPGWYYDGTKKQILLCPSSCDLVTNVKGKVDVVLGCTTVVQ